MLAKEAIKVSQDIYKVMSDVRSTRIAIFNGRPDEAKKLIALAQVDINAGLKDAKKFGLIQCFTMQPLAKTVF